METCYELSSKIWLRRSKAHALPIDFFFVIFILYGFWRAHEIDGL